MIDHESKEYKKLSTATQEMAEKIRPYFGDVTDGAGVAKEGIVAASMEGTDLTLDGMKAYNAHMTTLLNAVTVVTGEVAADAFKADEKLEKVTFHSSNDGCGQEFDLNWRRSQQVPDGNGGTRTVYGVCKARVDTVGMKPESKDFRTARQYGAKLIAGICS